MSREQNEPAREYNWPKDHFGRSEMVWQFWWLGPLLFMLTSVLVALLSNNNQTNQTIVIIYASQDQVYAEPILNDFTKQTGIKVRAVFDSEAVKTVGLANRLLAERAHPQCDVFWNNEELRTRQLAAQNVFRETNAWFAFGHRCRRFVINTNKLSFAAAPRSLIELTNAVWRGKVALAYPLFGTTATHFLALRQHWGDARWQMWCRALAENKPFLVDGNSVVVKLVARGEAVVGLTDSDDAAAEQRDGAPVAALPLGEESFLIPNTVAVVRGSKHPEAAQRLFDYLQSREVGDRLVTANALDGNATNQGTALSLKPDWEALLRDLDVTTMDLKQIFLR